MAPCTFFIGSQGGTLPTRNNVLSKQMPLFYSADNSREQENLEGTRCFTIAYKFKGKSGCFNNPENVVAIGDSGAFSHPFNKRWTFEEHLHNIFKWETSFCKKHKVKEWKFKYVSSYDMLIKETWVEGVKAENKWTLNHAQHAVDKTVQAARYLAENREILQDRKLILACQGINSIQYSSCVDQILEFAKPGDWIGLGSWCVLGLPLFKHYLIEFYKTINIVIPRVAQSGIKNIHLYGVRYEPAVAAFSYLCDKYNVQPSIDNARPILDCRDPSPKALKRCKARHHYWQDNCNYWTSYCANINKSRFYNQPNLELAIESLKQSKFISKYIKKLIYENNNFMGALGNISLTWV